MCCTCRPLETTGTVAMVSNGSNGSTLIQLYDITDLWAALVAGWPVVQIQYSDCHLLSPLWHWALLFEGLLVFSGLCLPVRLDSIGRSKFLKLISVMYGPEPQFLCCSTCRLEQHLPEYWHSSDPTRVLQVFKNFSLLPDLIRLADFFLLSVQWVVYTSFSLYIIFNFWLFKAIQSHFRVRQPSKFKK